eukprot:PhF_6_TR13167/c0_g1_i3/m.20765
MFHTSLCGLLVDCTDEHFEYTASRLIDTLQKLDSTVIMQFEKAVMNPSSSTPWWWFPPEPSVLILNPRTVYQQTITPKTESSLYPIKSSAVSLCLCVLGYAMKMTTVIGTTTVISSLSTGG